MEAAWPEELLSDHPRVLEPLRDRLPGALGQLKLDRLLSFALKHRGSFFDLAYGKDVSHAEPDQIAATQFAVYGGVEKREISMILRNLEPNTDGSDMLRHQWALLTNQTSLVPSGALRTNGR